MDDLDQTPLVSSSSDLPPRPQPQFKYQFVTEPEDEDEEEEEEEEDDDEDLEELEVLERKPFSELEYSQMGLSFGGASRKEAALVTDKDEEDDVVSNGVLHNRQEPLGAMARSVEEDRVKVLEQTKDGEGTGAAGVVREAPMREEYADFKPFERVWEVKGAYGDPYQPDGGLGAGGEAASAQESRAYKKYFADSLEQTSPEKDSESSNEVASLPSTPEAGGRGPEAYLTCAPFQPPAASSVAPGIFPLVGDHTVENKTDEKKIEEKKAQIGTENTSIKTSNPFLMAAQLSETDYVTTDGLSQVPAGAVVSVPEGLTPDLVQEACESELSEAAGTKSAYETKVDLVQTSEALQEALHPGSQLCPSFEDSEATPSPVLPDIVMEAPLTSVLPGAGPPAAQPTSSPLEAPQSNYENLKLESENPPPYEEAMSVPLKREGGLKEAVLEAEPAKATAAEAEAPYISIACDLIKGTKLSTELTPDFSHYSERAAMAQPGPDHSEPVEDSSPDSEPVDLFSDDSIPEVPEKQDEAVVLVKESLTATPAEAKEKVGVSPPEAAKPYLESFQPGVDPAAGSLLPGDVTPLTRKEKMPLPMEALHSTLYPDQGFFISKEAQVRESETFSDSSPIEIIDEFPTFGSCKTDFSPQFAREYTDVVRSLRSGVAETRDGAESLPCSEGARELALKDVQPRGQERSPVSEDFPKDGAAAAAGAPLPPPDVSPVAARPEQGRGGKPEVLVKEAEQKLPSDAESARRPPTAIFSAELSKTSVVDLLYWRDIKKSGVVFGASLFLLLSLTVFSIVSVTAYIALALLSVTIIFRVYKGVIQAVQKSDEGHPFRAYLESEVAISEELVQKYSNSALGHVNGTIKELRRLFLVDDLVDSLKFAVLMWVFTYVGALFNGLTLLILALISLFSVPVIYERHQAQIDHYIGLANKNVKDAMAKIQAKIPGLKRKAE
ncbi:PREDICTED: reticulon-4 isoform X2 [Elephantulus edwardii]|uniref:reticulon-4 isoform X2 n=1 Tax=Elephantulus edwardii TaxID=28737 RepID=UPI0003F08C94|nr:PREDICTED: reticulon-4 isoform X2 [Elephantulus edwardii]